MGPRQATRTLSASSRTLNGLARSTTAWLKQLAADFEAVRAAIAALADEAVEAARRWVEADSRTMMRLQRHLHRYKLCESAGWIPHYTTPLSLIEDDTDAADLSHRLNQYYKTNWPQVRSEFETRLTGLNVDEEARAAFLEGLQAHGYGLYRATPRLLFPEIERIARIELHGGRFAPITSLVEVRKAAINLRATEIVQQAGGPGVVLAQFKRMRYHLYETAFEQERVTQLATDPVPNRHATLHGLVSYRTMQSSLNALIMTEFMFRIIPALKTNPPD
jgi:hypothetical protein